MSKIINLLFGCLLVLILNTCSTNNDVESSQDSMLHIPSPDWEDQILYFIVTDRFMDGDSTNNDQGVGEYKKGDERFWNGGDINGITQKVDYIKELGATGIWITPPVANQWRNPQKSGTGNHGYWANSFVEVDKHYGTLEEYKDLSTTLHKNNMYLIQDVVCNHLGDFYTYSGDYNPDDVTQNFKLHDVPQPTQFPFNHNNALDPKDREMGIYHFAPNFYDHSDTIKKRAYQFADLDDLNTSNPVVRKALRESNNFWIKEVGVDGFRFDTPHMVEHDFWHDFIHSDDKENPGVEKFAKTLGKDKFVTFGETAVLSLPYDDRGTKEAAAYLGTEAKPEMTSVLNFPLFNTIQSVFKELKPTSQMTYRLADLKQQFPHPEYLFNFIDNHDGARFLSQADHASFQQALLFIMTIPGVPVIYYGTEQELLGTRDAMFKGGVGSPLQDRFDTQNESFQFVQELIALRKENEVFRKGALKVLRDVSDGPGVFAYELKYKDDYAMVIMNTSEAPKFVDKIPTDFHAGTTPLTIYNQIGSQSKMQVDQSGEINALLRPKSVVVLLPAKQEDSVSITEGNIKINPLKNKLISGKELRVNGKVEGSKDVKITVNGGFTKSSRVAIQSDGTWSATIKVDHLLNGTHRLSAFFLPDDESHSPRSDYLEFEINNPSKFRASYQDKVGDDYGPSGTYQYPTHVSFDGQMDIKSVDVFTIGNNLKVNLTMANLTQIWLPPNGFDHTLINIYIDLPNNKGSNFLPQQNAKTPDGLDWDYLISAAGFTNAAYSSKKASPQNPGTPVGPTASITADPQTNKITFLIPATTLGKPDDLEGAKIYINTWDGDPGRLKEMLPQASLWGPGGGKRNDPRIMDETMLIELK